MHTLLECFAATQVQTRYWSCYRWRHVVELFCIAEYNNCVIHHHTISSVSVRLYQITFANDTDFEIAEHDQNSRTTTFFTHVFSEENQNNILDGLLALWKMSGVVQKWDMAALLFRWLTVDDCLFPLPNILDLNL